ncbi:MAG TPA: DUF420 domain-containing protein [Cytophagales bacterium]|jgi:putative membrane protein|nr:DUF420 domain-containing protein [Cytophagales bacterium]
MEQALGKKNYTAWIIVLSIAIPVVVAILLFSPAKFDADAAWAKQLPHINAVINSLTAVFLVIGVYFIKKGDKKAHQRMMTSAFILGSLFLVSYVIYHATIPSTKFGGEGAIRYVYYFFLLSHILLAIVVVPFVLFAFYYALTSKFDKHKKVVKYTFPIWLYVSITGVIVYWMIAPFYQ